MGLDEQDRLVVAGLAKIELQRRSAVVHRAGSGDPLSPMEVTERHIVGGDRERGGRDGVVEDRMRLALPTTEHPTRHEQMRADHVDRIGSKGAGQLRDHAPDARVVPARVLIGVERHELRRADQATLGKKRHERDARGFALPGAQGKHAALVGPGEHGSCGDPTAGQQRGDGREPVRVIVVAGDDDHMGASVSKVEERAVDDPLSLVRRRGGIELVARYQDKVDAFRAGDLCDLGEHCLMLVGSAPSPDRPTDVPVRCVKDAHGASRITPGRAGPGEAGPTEPVARMRNAYVTDPGQRMSGAVTYHEAVDRHPTNPVTSKPGAERHRLSEARAGTADWNRWGPYVLARQWGTVREDYSADGDAWSYFPHEHARSRAYRWGEDGLAGICDRWQHLCLAVALWNERDPILKERLFGLDNWEGNHGEDVKEYWWPLDSTPTHSWMRWLYRYPQAEFPYARLVQENRSRGPYDPEFELADTGIFDDHRFFDVEVTYAKAGPNDLCIELTCTNHGPAAARLHLLPTVWLRNTWAWGRDNRRSQLWADEEGVIRIEHSGLGGFFLVAEGSPELLFTENETNAELLFGSPNRTPYTKDGINDHVVSSAPTVNPKRRGTKAAVWYRLDIPSGATATRRLRLANQLPSTEALEQSFTQILRARRAEADEFYATLAPPHVGDEARRVQRRALAGLLWSKKYYRYHVEEWLEGDPAGPPPLPMRAGGRNSDWTHLANTDIISMSDEWEYPWYAAWDLAFHTIPLALVDPDFAKNQLILLCREWYMHPNGQLPAYEWALSDVNPPVHAWAAWRVYKIDARASGRPDREFLARVFQKLLLNFTWWVNRKDTLGRNVFQGGFLGLDNISLFDRSQTLADGELEQADATSWMAMFCLNMLAIALELACHDRSYEDVATKFFEHFLAIAHAMNTIGHDGISLWDEEDGFFYDVLLNRGSGGVPLRVRSAVGVIPLFAVEIMEPEVLDVLPDFRDRMRWFRRHRPQLSDSVFTVAPTETGERHLLSLVSPRRLRRVLRRVLDPGEFLSPYGVRSMSRVHAGRLVRLELGGQRYEVAYEPGESTTSMYGGNSNWRGPVWFPINYLLVESLQKFHHFMGEGYTVEFPTGSGRQAHLDEVASELSRRLIALFLPDGEGRRPVNGGCDLFDHDPLWREHVAFNEYFHGETGAGLGANHQTGWTALVAKLIRQSGC
jgi:hypothetical protein